MLPQNKHINVLEMTHNERVQMGDQCRSSFPIRLETVALTYKQPGEHEEHEVDAQSPDRKASDNL